MSEPAATPLPTSLKANPRLSQWLRFQPDGTVQVRPGKVDLGQGISTALAQIVAEELDVDFRRIHMQGVSTASSPNEGMTSGSLSIQDSGSALRLVATQARLCFLDEIARQHGLDTDQRARLQVNDGQISIGTAEPLGSYWALSDLGLLERDAVPQACPQASEKSGEKSTHLHRLVGTPVQRLDLPPKLTGEAAFIHDLRLPGMLFGRVLHLPSPSAELLQVDLEAVKALPDVVATVRDGQFLGVIASREYAAVQAVLKLQAVARWREAAGLPNANALQAFLQNGSLETSVVGERLAAATSTQPETGCRQRLNASYSRPFLAHGSIGPSCAVARYAPKGDATQLEVWTHSQGIFNLRADLALILELPAQAITVNHVEGAGCYGHNGADDVACDAALLARAVPGQAVQVTWSREDELGVAPFGPAMWVELQAELNPQGHIANWQHQVWSNGHGMRPGRGKVPVLLAASQLEKPFAPQVSVNAALAAGGGAERNAVPLYHFESFQATSHRLLTMPVRSSALRSLGAHGNVFAAESFMDEIAHAVVADPLEFRLRHLGDSASDARARDVLLAATQRAAWALWQQKQIDRPPGHGMGLGLARYKNTGAFCAVVALVDASADLRVVKLWIAVDVGQVINPDGVANQIEGGAIQTVSWVLKEAVQFDDTRILSTTWGSYPILKFSEVPEVDVYLINRPELPSLGAGEATHGPVAAAIANALFDATGLRMRHMPFTPERLRQAALAL